MTETLADLMGWTTDDSNPHIKYYFDLVQHTEEWKAARCGILTASVMHGLVTPTGKIAENDETRSIMFDLVCQRVHGMEVVNSFQSYDMARGVLDEVDAARLYDKNHNELQSCGFLVNDRHGFKLGFSPDGLLVKKRGQIETKSANPVLQLKTIMADEMPKKHIPQVQAGLLVSEREFCDFNSYCGGMPMFTIPVYPDDGFQKLLLEAAENAEEKMTVMEQAYRDRILNDKRLIPTVKRKEEIN
jgi:hypothetical protein